MRTCTSGVYGEIDSLPGCSQVGVSHAVYVPESLRGAGLGKKANIQRLRYMGSSLGYDYALCTVDAANIAQIKILQDNEWEKLSWFTSSKTGHRVEIWGYKLNVKDIE